MNQTSYPKATHILLVCLKYKFAKDFFAKGAVRFAEASEWDYEEKDGCSRGDRLEGVFTVDRHDGRIDRDALRSLRNDITSYDDEGATYYKSAEVTGFRAYCMYGLNDTNMRLNERRSQDHKFHKSGKVSKEYFRRLFPQWQKDEYEKSDDEERPVVLFINNPHRFIELMTNRLLELGVRKSEIVCKPVLYIDFKKESFVIPPVGEELFYKHIDFEEQSEIRIAIDTRRPEVKTLFDRSNGVIELGPIDKSIASLSELWFEDMQVEICDKELLYSLAKPVVSEVTSEAIVCGISYVLEDEHPKSPMTIEQMEAQISEYAGWLRDRGDTYDPQTHCVTIKGISYDLASTTVCKMVSHYQHYMVEGDLKSAKETIDKIHHFYPMYNLEHYFENYYQRANSH